MKRFLDPRQLKLPLVDIYEEHAQTYWLVLRQWNNQQLEGDRILTAGQAIKALGDIIDNFRLPQKFRKQVAALQMDIINNGRRKKSKKIVKTASVVSIRWVYNVKQ